MRGFVSLFSSKLLVGALFFIVFAQGVFLLDLFPNTRENYYPEIKELASKNLNSFQEFAFYFQNVAENKGGAYAFEVLKIAPIAPNIDMHLMGHVVGDILYRQQGLAGMDVCTHDFRNACSHTIVVGLFLEDGEEALDKIAEACRNAPGGQGAYTMCFHGLGHGILAYAGYDLEKTVGLCKKTGTQEYRNQEYSQCVGGAIMEMVGGGFHDQELWRKQKKVYFSGNDPFSPCNREFISQEIRSICYVYLTPHFLEIVGADLGHPTPADFQRAFLICDKIPASDKVNRNVCYGGFGKEFVVLAQNRDIRNPETMTDEELGKIYTWCFLAEKEEGITSCVRSAVSSLYWGGENDPHLALRFCMLMAGKQYKSSCMDKLIDNVGYYIQDQKQRNQFCDELDVQYQEDCQTRLQQYK